MQNKPYRIAVFASGSGTNAGQIFSYFSTHPKIDVCLLLSNNPNAYVLERAKSAGVESRVFDRVQFFEKDAVLEWLHEKEITHLVLAGFLWLMPGKFIHSFPDRIVNIHPALLPRFGGKGMYGMKVHEAVKASGVNETGITIHLVNERFDEGKILFQAKIAVVHADTPEDIATKVHQLEYAHYAKVVEGWITGMPLNPKQNPPD